MKPIPVLLAGGACAALLLVASLPSLGQPFTPGSQSPMDLASAMDRAQKAESRLATLEAQVKSLQQRLNSSPATQRATIPPPPSQTVDARLDKMESRLAAIERKVPPSPSGSNAASQNWDHRISGLERRLSALERQSHSSGPSTSQLENRIRSLESQVKRLESKR